MKNLTEKELANLYLQKLKIRFETKINYDKYYLSYSGGKDSHLLYWFIKNVLKTDRIKIVSVNTRLEHVEIRKRMYANADVVLLPEMFPTEIIEKYGMPCFTKQQDEFIKRYQNGLRSEFLMKQITREEKSKYNLNKKASKLCLEGKLHRISNRCCDISKKQVLTKWGKENNRKEILGVRGTESSTRQAAYHTCLSKKGRFTPLYDFTDDVVNAIYNVYDIPIPKLYQYTKRSGCIGCPYINNVKRIEMDLRLATEQQRKYIIKLFKESYDVKGVNYKQFIGGSRQMDILDFIKESKG